MDGDNSLEDLNILEDLDRQVDQVSSYHQEKHNSKNLSSPGNQDKRVEENKDKGFSSRSSLSGKFCCQSVN